MQNKVLVADDNAVEMIGAIRSLRSAGYIAKKGIL